MKTLVIVLSVFFLIGGILFICIGGEINDNATPQKITVGITSSDGSFIPTKTMTGSTDRKKAETADTLNGMGYLLIAVSIGGLIGSCFIKPQEKINY